MRISKSEKRVLLYHHDNNSLNEIFKDELVNFHHNHCSKFAKNTFEFILIGDSNVAGLTWYQNVWEKFLKPLTTLNCGIGGDRIQHISWRALNTKPIKENSDVFGDFIFENFSNSATRFFQALWKMQS